MGDTGKFKLYDDTMELHRLDETTRSTHGRIEYDELGNAVWVAVKGLSSKEALARLLNDESLAFTQDDPKGTVRRIQDNPGGVKKGYDPYDSGLLLKKQWKKKKDLHALSKWIVTQKKHESND